MISLSCLQAVADDFKMPSFALPCPDIGQFAYTFEPMKLDSNGHFIQHSFYFADSVADCLRKQAAMHRWDCDSRGVAESEAAL